MPKKWRSAFFFFFFFKRVVINCLCNATKVCYFVYVCCWCGHGVNFVHWCLVLEVMHFFPLGVDDLITLYNV